MATPSCAHEPQRDSPASDRQDSILGVWGLAKTEEGGFEFDRIDPGVKATLWLADELRRRGAEIRGRRAWAGSRRKIHRTIRIPAPVGTMTV